MEKWEDWESIIEDLDSMGHDVSGSEADFLESLLERRPPILSSRQVAWLKDMQYKYLVF